MIRLFPAGFPEPWVYRLARTDLSTASTEQVRASRDAQELIRRARNARKKARKALRLRLKKLRREGRL